MGRHYASWEIVRSPNLQTVAGGAKVRFILHRKRRLTEKPVKPETIQWRVYRSTDNGDRGKHVKSGNVELYREESEREGQILPGIDIAEPMRSRPFEVIFSNSGRYLITCSAKWDDGQTFVYQGYQWVDQIETVLAVERRRMRGEEAPDPNDYFMSLLGILRLMQRVFEDFKDSKHEAQTRKRIKQYEAFRLELGALIINYTQGGNYYPMRAVLLDLDTSTRTDLRLFLGHPSESNNLRWQVVDWTMPGNSRLSGKYPQINDGSTEASREVAIQKALAKWRLASNENYPRGRVIFDIPAEVTGVALEGEFETGIKSAWDKVEKFFNTLAFWTSVSALVVAGLITGPGSVVVSGLLWLSLFSSTTAAVISIGRRYQRGQGDWSDYAFDVLTIAGNLFGAGQMIWRRGAAVLANNPVTGQRLKYSFYGQVLTDSFQGVLLAADSMQAIIDILSNQDIPVEERVEKALVLMGNLARDGAMVVVSVKLTKNDIADLNSGRANIGEMQRLKNPDIEIDTTKPPKFEGETKKGKLKVQERHEQQRAPAHPEDGSRPKAKPGEFPEPRPPKERGMRPEDDLAFAEAAREGGNIIIVRESNDAALEWVDKPGYKPKPENLKAKTRQGDPNRGLAAADRADKKLQRALANKKPPMTYDEYIEDLFNDGYVIGDPKKPANDPKISKEEREARLRRAEEEGYIIRDKAGNAFYSDYDLHGVYDSKTGKKLPKNDLDRVIDDLNADFGKPMIQHGPHDEWIYNNDPVKAGPNAGPQPPVTVYMPDGSVHRLPDKKSMRDFYRKHGIDTSIYGDELWKD